MSEYYPDGWVVILTGANPTPYRVFGSWNGGYLDGHVWRLNSGITRCYLDGDYYCFTGQSGSTYHCHKNGYYRLNAFSSDVLYKMIKESYLLPEIMSHETDWLNVNWEG
jgi:hypothetical protein